MSAIAIYQHQDGSIDVRVERETVWLTQEQMGMLFGRDRSVIGRHVKAVFRDGELDRKSNVQKMHVPPADKPTTFYSLDVVISVGYCVKSPEGVRFRPWASRVLRVHLVRGYTLNRQRLEANAAELETALKLVRATLKSPELTAEAGTGLADIVARYTQTFLWLQRYDEGLLSEPTGHAGGVLPTWREATTAVARLKADLTAKGQAGDLFGHERDEGLLSYSETSTRPCSANRLIPAWNPALRTCFPVFGRQQAHRIAAVRRFSAPQRAAHPGRRHTGRERRGARRAVAAGRRIQACG